MAADRLPADLERALEMVHDRYLCSCRDAWPLSSCERHKDGLGCQAPEDHHDAPVIAEACAEVRDILRRAIAAGMLEREAAIWKRAAAKVDKCCDHNHDEDGCLRGLSAEFGIHYVGDAMAHAAKIREGR